MNSNLKKLEQMYRQSNDIQDPDGSNEMLLRDMARLDSDFHEIKVEFNAVKSLLMSFQGDVHKVRDDIKDLTKSVRYLGVIAVVALVIVELPWEFLYNHFIT